MPMQERDWYVDPLRDEPIPSIPPIRTPHSDDRRFSQSGQVAPSAPEYDPDERGWGETLLIVLVLLLFALVVIAVISGHAAPR